MVVIIKIGRILPKNWVAQQFRKTGGFFSFQSNMWEMWKSSLSKFRTDANKDLELGKDSLNVNIRFESEPYDNRVIQWQICECSSFDKDREQLCIDRFEDVHKAIKKNYDKMKENKDINIKKQTPFTDTITKGIRVTGNQVKDVIKKGLNKEGNKSVSQSMLDLDIIIDVQLEENEIVV